MTAATGRDTWNASGRPWKPCPDTEPHPRHEWFDGVKREDCPGVSAATVDLTRQQTRAMEAFLWLPGPEGFDTEAFDGSVWDQCVRPWPTMDNLVKLGLIERVQWWDEEAGWQYELTDAGKAYMRTVVEARRAA